MDIVSSLLLAFPALRGHHGPESWAQLVQTSVIRVTRDVLDAQPSSKQQPLMPPETGGAK